MMIDTSISQPAAATQAGGDRREVCPGSGLRGNPSTTSPWATVTGTIWNTTMRLTKKIQTLALEVANGVDESGHALIVELAKAGYGPQGEKSFKIRYPEGDFYIGHTTSKDGFAFVDQKTALRHGKKQFEKQGCEVVRVVPVIVDTIRIEPRRKRYELGSDDS